MSPDPDWRTRHCAEPAAEAIYQVSGRDVWAELGGCPRSWRDAAALYRRLGARTLADVVTKVLGPPIDRRQARRGDVVMVQGSLGVCAGEVAVCIGGTVRMTEVERAWSARGSPRPGSGRR